MSNKQDNLNEYQSVILEGYAVDGAADKTKGQAESMRKHFLKLASQCSSADVLKTRCKETEDWLRSGAGGAALKARGIKPAINKRNGLYTLPRSWSVRKAEMVRSLKTVGQGKVQTAAKDSDYKGLMAEVVATAEEQKLQEAAQAGDTLTQENISIRELISSLDSDRVELHKAEDSATLEAMGQALSALKDKIKPRVKEAKAVNATGKDKEAKLPAPDVSSKDEKKGNKKAATKAA